MDIEDTLEEGTVFITVTDTGMFDVMVVGDSYIGCFDYQGLMDARSVIEDRREESDLVVDRGSTITKYTNFDRLLADVVVLNLDNGFSNLF